MAHQSWPVLQRALAQAAVLCGLLLLVTPAVPAAAGPDRPFYATDFSAGLDGWEHRNAATFALDPDQGRGDSPCARVTVPPGTELRYQQFSRYFTEDIAAGDVFSGSVWVRTQGVTADPGAYFVLEFLEGDRRVNIYQSRVGAANGRDAWQELVVSAALAGPGTNRLRVGLILHAHGTARFDDLQVVRTQRAFRESAGAEREIVVDATEIVNPRFGGVGFHVFYHCHDASPELLDTVIAKRWRELNPSFARATHYWTWDSAKLDYVAAQMRLWQQTGTEVYLTTWDPKDTSSAAERRAYAREVAAMLEFFVRRNGINNLTTYCLTNELSLGKWGVLREDLPKFRSYHQAFFDELRARRLPVKLLATDASPVDSWSTLEWAAENMDGITGVYGGHHYFNEHSPDDETFYAWFLDRVRWGAGIARAKGKGFILGEFGCRQDGRTVDGKRNDACTYWNTPQEPYVGIQLSEGVIAALNGGAYALGNWTFMDFPDTWSATGQNKWGTSKWSGDDHSTRPHYYAYGLLTRYFRGPAAVLTTATNDPRLRVAAVRHLADETVSIAVVNRSVAPVAVTLRARGLRGTARCRKYVYNPVAVPMHPFGDLPPPAGVAEIGGDSVRDTLPPMSLTVYTSAFDETAPRPVAGVRANRRPRGPCRIQWDVSRESDLCYYRVFRGAQPDFSATSATQIGSTVATRFVDAKAPADGQAYYRVVGVDLSGNSGPASTAVSAR